jgi:hypothetical protein
MATVDRGAGAGAATDVQIETAATINNGNWGVIHRIEKILCISFSPALIPFRFERLENLLLETG